ncbi:MAG: hypothetical protein AB1Z98_18395 [Nannocystaceae bacterium]
MPLGRPRARIHFKDNGDILVAPESYSKPGADRIVSLGYDETSTLQTLLDEGTTMLPNLATAQGPGPLDELTPQDPIFAGLLLTDFQ